MLWDLLGSYYKKIPIKNRKYIVNLLYVLETTQKWLMFWTLLGSSYKKVLTKSSEFILHSLYILEIFRNHPKMFPIFEFIA